MLKFRQARESDVQIYFDWANDETVRQNSINPAKIGFDEHVKWFMVKLHDPQTIMLVFVSENQEIGQIRIEIDHVKCEAIINYSIDKRYRGKGFGTKILTESQSYYKGIQSKYPLVGFVKPGNVASVFAFRKAGFEEHDQLFFINKEEYLKFSKFHKL
jgi:RimJ/RimL family protein N-acetyltransferase